MIDPEKRGEPPEEGLVPANNGIEKQGIPEFSGFSSLVDKLFNDFDDVVAGIDPEKLSRGELTPEEKQKIIDLIKTISSTILSFKNDTDSSTLSEEEINYVAAAESRLMVITVKAFMWRITRDDLEGKSTEEGVKEDGEEEGLSEAEKFKSWKDGFANKRNSLAGNIDTHSKSDDVTPLKEELNALEKYVDDAMMEFDSRSFENFQKLVQKLKERIGEISKPAEPESEDWSEFSPDHRPELVSLYNLVNDNEPLLVTASWDPRTDVPGNLIDKIKRQLEEADAVRAAIVSDLGGLKGLDADKDIKRIYVVPAENFLKKLETRAKEIDDQKIETWKTDLEDPSKFPKVVLLKAEIDRPLPVKPYGADTPEERIKALKGDGGVLAGLIKDAQAELDVAGYLPGEMRVVQKDHVEKEYFDKARETLDALDLLSGELTGDKEVDAWSATIKEFKETVEEILALPSNIDIASNKTKLLDLETKLSTSYEKALTGWFISPLSPPPPAAPIKIELLDYDIGNDFLKKNIISLVGMDRKSGKYLQAKEKIEKLAAPIHEEAESPANMSWEDLTREIERLNIDVYNHQEFQSASANVYNVSIYNAFHARKGALDMGNFATEAEYLEKEQERIDSVAWIVLSKLESLNQNEGQVPTCTRPDLFPTLMHRQVERNFLLKSTTYHPEHGSLMREMLDDVILAVCQRDPKTDIFYTEICGSGKGRSQIDKYMRDNFNDRAMAELYQDLPEDERKKKVDQFFKLANVTWNLFDLLTVAFAELQKNTQTGAHQKTKNGNYLEMDNYVAITRPDAAAVHSTQRYDSPSHPSALFGIVLKRWPADYGKLDLDPDGVPYHDKLVEQQHELLTFQDAIYDISRISGDNGIEPTSVFDPLFPDTRSFLHLSDKQRGNTEMLEFGSDVWGLNDAGDYVNLGKKGTKITLRGKEITLKESFAVTGFYEGTAMTGWKKIMKLTFGILPGEITRDMILNHSDTGGDDADLGFIDIMINNGCGMAKMFPGRHMEAVEQLFTLYLMRIFQRYRSNPRYRKDTFQRVVSKIQNASTAESGLGGHRKVAASIIRNISDPKFKDWDDEMILNTSSKKFKMGEVLQDGVNKRRKQRVKWVIDFFKHEGLIPPHTKIPLVGEWAVSVSRMLDKFSQIDQAEFWEMVNGEEPLPEVEINRTTGLFKSVDPKESH